MMIEKREGLYKTSDLSLSAFLMSHGAKFQRAEKANGRMNFVFLDSGNIDSLIAGFIAGNDVSIQEYLKNVNILKKILFGDY